MNIVVKELELWVLGNGCVILVGDVVYVYGGVFVVGGSLVINDVWVFV